VTSFFSLSLFLSRGEGGKGFVGLLEYMMGGMGGGVGLTSLGLAPGSASYICLDFSYIDLFCTSYVVLNTFYISCISFWWRDGFLLHGSLIFHNISRATLTLGTYLCPDRSDQQSRGHLKRKSEGSLNNGEAQAAKAARS
jgi:hypothetical protein